MADPKLVHLLPPEIACRFHALPVAQDQGRVTVVMADPDDPEALAAIAHALGPEPCVLQGDAETIDGLLAEAWAEQMHCGPRMLVAPPTVSAGDLWAYALSLGDLLHAEVNRTEGTGDLGVLAGPGVLEYDLLVVGEPDHPWIDSFFRQSWRHRPGNSRPIPFGVCVARRPRWPLQSILLIICGEGSDEGAVDWVLRLAQPGISSVTALAVAAPLPALHNRRTEVEDGLPALLAADTPLGRHLRRAASRLVEQNVPGQIRVRQGPPDWQVKRELVATDHDLVAIGLPVDRCWRNRFEGSLAAALLNWTERPVLLVDLAVTTRLP